MPGPAAYTVEVQFGTFFGLPIWVDVSQWVDLRAGFTIGRGKSDEASQPTPGRLTVPLFNDDGRFTPGRAGSPYYPYVQDGAPVRVTARVAAPDGNLEDNPSHELGIAEWSTSGFGAAPTVAPSSTHVFGDSGTWAMLATWPAATTFAAAQRTIYGLDVGRQYTWSRYVWVPTGSPTVLLAVQGITSGAASAVNDTWTRVSVTFTATATSHVLQLSSTSNTAGQCWTDAGRGDPGGAAGAVTGQAGARLLSRFTGKALEWPMSWEGSGAQAAATSLVAVGVTQRLSDHAGDLRSFAVEEAKLDAPWSYFPLDEPEGATQAGNLGGWQSPAALVRLGAAGTAVFGAGTGPPADGSSSLVLTPSTVAIGYYLVAQSFAWAATAVTVEAFIACTAVNGTLVDLGPTAVGGGATQGLRLRVNASGKLSWESDGGALIVASTASVNDGATHHVAAVYQHTGANHTVQLYIDGAAAQSGSFGSAALGVGWGYALVGGGPKSSLFSGTLNHVGVYLSALPAGRIKAHRDAGVTGFGGERSDQRISRLAAYSGLVSLTPANRTAVWVLNDAGLSILGTSTTLAASDLAVDVGSAAIYGQSAGGQSALAAMQAVAATEGGTVLEDRDGFVDFQSRAHRYNLPAGVALDCADVDPSLTLTYDDQDVVNIFTGTTQDGAAVRYIDQPSIDQRGRYERSLSSLSRDASDVLSAGTWQVNRKKAPAPRYTQVRVELATLDATTVARVLTVDVGDRFDVLNIPGQAPAPSAALFCEGYTETVSLDTTSVVFNTSSATGYQVWQLDSATNSVLDSTTVLAY